MYYGLYFSEKLKIHLGLKILLDAQLIQMGYHFCLIFLTMPHQPIMMNESLPGPAIHEFLIIY